MYKYLRIPEKYNFLDLKNLAPLPFIHFIVPQKQNNPLNHYKILAILTPDGQMDSWKLLQRTFGLKQESKVVRITYFFRKII